MKLWTGVRQTQKLNHKVKFKLEYIMEVDDFELLELVNDYQERCEVSTFNTLDDIPEALMIEALYEANYIEDEKHFGAIKIGH